jgi:hypothetical protein
MHHHHPYNPLAPGLGYRRSSFLMASAFTASMPESRSAFSRSSSKRSALIWVGTFFVGVKEDRIAWTGLAAEFLDEGLALFEQRLVNPRRHRNHAARQLLLPGPALWHSNSPPGYCRRFDLGVNLAGRSLAAIRRSASSTLHLASIASITASQTACGSTSFWVMSSRLTQ